MNEYNEYELPEDDNEYYDNDNSELTGELKWNNTSEHNYNFFNTYN